jgi:hypothetical protein
MSFYIDALSKQADGRTTARRVGEYWSHDEAVAAAKHLIDACLFREYRNAVARGITPEELLELYAARGERPVILRQQKGETSTNISRFDAQSYAEQRCAEICGVKPQD